MKKRIFLSPPHMSGYEHQLVAEAFESNYIVSLGPQVGAFVQELPEKINIAYAVAISSGTADMHLALKSLGIKAGDDVFASTLTFIGSAVSIEYLGLDRFLLIRIEKHGISIRICLPWKLNEQYLKLCVKKNYQNN